MVSAHNSKRLPNEQSYILDCCNSLNHLVDTVRNNWNAIQDYIMRWHGPLQNMSLALSHEGI